MPFYGSNAATFMFVNLAIVYIVRLIIGSSEMYERVFNKFQTLVFVLAILALLVTIAGVLLPNF